MTTPNTTNTSSNTNNTTNINNNNNNNPTESCFMAVMGSGGVGKSCLTVRFLKNEFTHEYDPTVGECIVDIV